MPRYFREFCVAIYLEVLSAALKNFVIQFARNNEYKINETVPRGIRRAPTPIESIRSFVILHVVFTLPTALFSASTSFSVPFVSFPFFSPYALIPVLLYIFFLLSDNCTLSLFLSSHIPRLYSSF